MKVNLMSIVRKAGYVSFILLMVVSGMACNHQASDGNGTSDGKNTSERDIGARLWMANMNETYEQAVKIQKPILVYFTSSDTCGLCQQWDAGVLASPDFKAWAENNVVLLKVEVAKGYRTANANPEQNEAMVEYLKITTYPVLWVLDVTHEAENGRFKIKPIGYTGYKATTGEIIGSLQNLLRR